MTSAGDINMDSNDVYGLPDPPEQQSSAVPLSYINSIIGLYLPLTGGVMSGDIAMGTKRVTGLSALRFPNVSLYEFLDSLQVATPSGYGTFGPRNGSFCHFTTDRPRYHMDKPLTVAGVISASDGVADTDVATVGQLNSLVPAGLMVAHAEIDASASNLSGSYTSVLYATMSGLEIGETYLVEATATLRVRCYNGGDFQAGVYFDGGGATPGIANNPGVTLGAHDHWVPGSVHSHGIPAVDVAGNSGLTAGTGLPSHGHTSGSFETAADVSEAIDTGYRLSDPTAAVGANDLMYKTVTSIHQKLVTATATDLLIILQASNRAGNTDIPWGIINAKAYTT